MTQFGQNRANWDDFAPDDGLCGHTLDGIDRFLIPGCLYFTH